MDGASGDGVFRPGVAAVMADKKSRKSLDDLDARLRQVSSRHESRIQGNEERRISTSGVGLAFRIALDIVAGTALGVAIGYGLDYWLGTLPLFLILFLLLGFVAGFMNVYRTLTGQGYAVGYQQNDDADNQPKPGDRGSEE
jgi:ATP synthase protein I